MNLKVSQSRNENQVRRCSRVVKQQEKTLFISQSNTHAFNWCFWKPFRTSVTMYIKREHIRDEVHNMNDLRVHVVRILPNPTRLMHGNDNCRKFSLKARSHEIPVKVSARVISILTALGICSWLHFQSEAWECNYLVWCYLLTYWLPGGILGQIDVT